jgi:PIN domain nuclease of toxin-antitoxin system
VKSKHVILSVGCIALLIAGCSRTNFTSIQSPATPLIDTFHSYTSIADVQTALRSSGVTWATIEDSHLPPGDRRPPFDILAISVSHYPYLGHTGELQLHFFNNRLMSTWFFPDDPASFTAALEAAMKIRMRPEASVPPFTRIWTRKNYQDRIYVAWEDTRLSKEESSWIASYS